MHLISELTLVDQEILEQSIVFNGLSMQELQPFFDACQIQLYRPGQAIMSSGDAGDGLYVVLQGKVEVLIPQGGHNRSKAASGDYFRIDLLETGVCFGEYSLVDQKKVSATVCAFTATRLFYLSTENFYLIAGAYLRIENIIYKNILKLLIARCRDVNEELEEDALMIY